MNIDIFLTSEAHNPTRKVSTPCDKCNGDCCGVIPLKEDFVKKMFVKYKLTPILGRVKKLKQNPKTIPGHKMYRNSDGMCIFKVNNRCAIYEDRPTICKCYGETTLVRCPYENLDEQPENLTERNRLVNNNNMLRERLINEASIKYFGDKYGKTENTISTGCRNSKN